MTTKTLYPQTLTQTSETNTSYREFNNLNNLKNKNNTYARTGQIASKSGTHKRPSTITATKFSANLPTGSKINKITVEYEAAYEGNISIGKTSLDLVNVNVAAKNGKSLTKTVTKSSVSFTGNFSIGSVNSNSFGVKLSFPSNTKADVGYVKVKYIRIIIDYKAPNYTITTSKVDGTYTGDNFKVKVNISNVNKTDGDSNVTIQLPSGVSYQGKDSGNGSVTSSGQVLTWKPGLSSKNSNANVILILEITTDGSHTIKVKENATNHTSNLSISTSPRPDYDGGESSSSSGINVNEGTNTPKFRALVGEEIPLTVSLDDATLNIPIEEGTTFSFYLDAPSGMKEHIFHKPYGDDTWANIDINPDCYEAWDRETNALTDPIKVDTIGTFELEIKYWYLIWNEEEQTIDSITATAGTVLINIVPEESSLTTPNMTILQLTPDE